MKHVTEVWSLVSHVTLPLIASLPPEDNFSVPMASEQLLLPSARCGKSRVINWGMVLAIPALGWQYHGFGEWASAHPPLSITFWALSFTVGRVVGKRDALLNFFSTSGRAWYVYPVVGRRESTADDGHAWSSGAGLWLVVSSSLSDCIIRNKMKCTMTGKEWPWKGRKKDLTIYIYSNINLEWRSYILILYCNLQICSQSW